MIANRASPAMINRPILSALSRASVLMRTPRRSTPTWPGRRTSCG